MTKSETMTTNRLTTIKQVLDLNERLLRSITEGDWETYADCAIRRITAFEPEARGQLVEGMEFHGFYFDLGGTSGPHNTTICRRTCGCWTTWRWSATCGWCNGSTTPASRSRFAAKRPASGTARKASGGTCISIGR